MHKKNRILLLYLLINYIPATYAPNMISLKDEYTLRLQFCNNWLLQFIF